MAVIHISEAELARDVRAVFDRVNAGEVVYIDSGNKSYSLAPATHHNKPRMITDVIAELERRGSKATLDPGFADDVEDGIRSHQNEPRFDPWE